MEFVRFVHTLQFCFRDNTHTSQNNSSQIHASPNCIPVRCYLDPHELTGPTICWSWNSSKLSFPISATHPHTHTHESWCNHVVASKPSHARVLLTSGNRGSALRASSTHTHAPQGSLTVIAMTGITHHTTAKENSRA